MKIIDTSLIVISTPVLVLGWALFVMGLYYLAASIFGFATNEENTSLAAIWEFLFSFGAITTAGMLAGKAKYASKSYLRQIYKYSLIISATMFLGYSILMFVAGLIV